MTAPTNALELPLDGVRLVEASAGTGKTFTIATLYLRLLLERGLGIDEIVVATFTRAAAAELARRLRERLVLADELLAQADPATGAEGDDGVTREVRKVIRAALVNTGLADLRKRARNARLAIDTAFIGTLHGFCHRVLADFGFDTGQALIEPELIEDIRELETEIVRDFWRRGSVDSATAALLAGTWKTADALAAQVWDARWRGRNAEVPVPDMQALELRFRDARRRIADWQESVLRAATDALHPCVSHPPTLKKRLASLRELHAWARSPADDDPSNAAAIEHATTLCAKALDGVNPKGEHASGEAFGDIEALCAANAAIIAAPVNKGKLPAAHLLRDARTYIETERPRRLAERNLMGHDEAVDRLASALADPVRGAAVAQRIRERWKAALVDEFQDTDTRQWQVVKALFGETTLVLVGDPKQAIYGFRGGDVFAWLEARKHAQGEPLQLRNSWRAGEGFCDAINALFSRKAAFIDAGIDHPDIRSARPQRAFLRDGERQAALQVWWMDPESVGHAEGKRAPSKAHAESAIQHACVAWIRDMLDGRSQLRDEKGLEPLHAKHIAVLVDSNAQAAAMQAALGRAGVAAASNLRASVYASAEAADLSLLLEALANPDDMRRGRAAHASLLVGVDAATIAGSRDEDTQGAHLLEAIAGWAAAAARHGPLAWLHALLQSAAPRLLALPDGERRVANYLQLAELLQDLHAHSFGLDDLATRFASARVDAHEDADAARLRLDNDADAVTISTVHAAKGLEYPVVLVPYAVLGHDPGPNNRDGRPRLHWYHDEGNRAHVAIGPCADDTVAQRAIDEIRAEDIRKFYVAVTRAAALCVLPYGPTSATCHSAPFHLLHVAGHEPDERIDDSLAGCKVAVRQLCERAGDAVACVELPLAAASDTRKVRKEKPEDLQARGFARTTLERDWQMWSFSRLVRGSANAAAADPLPGTGDADAAAVHAEDVTADAGLAGARFGTAVHAVFEQTDFAAWRDAAGVPTSERAWIESALRQQGLAQGDAALKHAVPVVGDFVRGALNATLPCDVRLCDMATDERKAEIEFHLTLAPARSAALFALLHRYGYQQQRSGVNAETLQGLMTGKIDLTFRHAGRFHIVDWKTNRCAPYDAASMRAEIAAHDYDLQWLIYTLALHRWLRQRLPDYDYDHHVGEVYYLFVRGMAQGAGVHVDRPPRELIEATDALFASPLENAA